MDRYQRIYNIGEKLYQIGSPIMIEAGVLLRDTINNTILAQIKFRNLSNKVIKALQIGIDAYDVGEIKLEGVDNFQYLDLMVKQGSCFGSQTAITMPLSNTRSYKIKNVIVFFTDGSKWETFDEWTQISKPNKILLNGEERKQYQIEFGREAEYLYEEQLDVWTCVCGEINKEEKCYLCGQTQEHLKSISKKELHNNLLERLEREKNENEARKIKEIREREKQLLEEENKRQEAEIHRKRTIKRICVLSPAIIIILVIMVILLQPLIEKGKVSNLVNEKEYSEALELAQAIGGDEYVITVKKKIINSYVVDDKYVQAINLSKEIQDEQLLLDVTMKYAEHLENTDVLAAIEQYNNVANISSDANSRMEELENIASMAGVYKCTGIVTHWDADAKTDDLWSEGRGTFTVKVALVGNRPLYTINWLDTDIECSPGDSKTVEIEDLSSAYIDIDWTNSGYIKATYRFSGTYDGVNYSNVETYKYSK